MSLDHTEGGIVGGIIHGAAISCNWLVYSSVLKRAAVCLLFNF